MPIYKMDGKKDGKQKYRVRVNYQDSSGKARQIDRVVYGLTEAKDLEKELTGSIRDDAAGRSLTVSQLHDEYIASRTKSVRESTSSKSQSIINNHVIPAFGSTAISRLYMPTLQRWKNIVDGSDLSLRMKQNIYKEFHALLNYAVKMDYLPQNPLNKLGNFTDASAAPQKMDYYTADEFRCFIAAAKQRADVAFAKSNYFEFNYYVFFNLAFYTGMRKGEINSLRWSDIDGEYISVRRSVNQKLHGDDVVTPPKNRSSIRTIQMPKPLIGVLMEHKDRCRRIEGFNDDCLICGVFRALRDSSIENRNIRYAADAGVKKIRIHDFRHSHASLLANEGINIQEIARRLGHANIEMTWNTYSHLYPREEERAVKILDKIV